MNCDNMHKFHAIQNFKIDQILPYGVATSVCIFPAPKITVGLRYSIKAWKFERAVELNFARNFHILCRATLKEDENVDRFNRSVRFVV